MGGVPAGCNHVRHRGYHALAVLCQDGQYAILTQGEYRGRCSILQIRSRRSGRNNRGGTAVQHDTIQPTFCREAIQLGIVHANQIHNGGAKRQRHAFRVNQEQVILLTQVRNIGTIGNNGVCQGNRASCANHASCQRCQQPLLHGTFLPFSQRKPSALTDTPYITKQHFVFIP